MTETDPPEEFDKLSPDKQQVVLGWIRKMLIPARTEHPFSSYVIKHDFEASPGGFYISNGEFKGAMRAAGFKPINPREQNWRFKIKPYAGQGQRA